MKERTFFLPEFFSTRIATELERLGFSFSHPKRLADAVLRLSDHYNNNPSAMTQWKETWAQAASLAYFFPLNYARNLAVAREAKRLGFFTELKTLFDFGSGTGSALLAFLDEMPAASPPAELNIFAVDSSQTALDLANCLDANGLFANHRNNFSREVVLAVETAVWNQANGNAVAPT